MFLSSRTYRRVSADTPDIKPGPCFCAMAACSRHERARGTVEGRQASRFSRGLAPLALPPGRRRSLPRLRLTWSPRPKRKCDLPGDVTSASAWVNSSTQRCTSSAACFTSRASILINRLKLRSAARRHARTHLMRRSHTALRGRPARMLGGRGPRVWPCAAAPLPLRSGIRHRCPGLTVRL